MKKQRILTMLALSIVSTIASARECLDSCQCQPVSSYISAKPHYHMVMPELISGFRDDRAHANKDGMKGAFEFAVYGSKSTNDRNLARYFFPNCKTDLLVHEEIGVSEDGGDLLAQHFNIYTTNGDFLSRIQIRPEQSVIGFGLQYRKSFNRCEEKGRGFWWSFIMPIERVKNDLRFCETIINDGGGIDEAQNAVVVANMTEAFQQGDWLYGKIGQTSLSETKIADIELRIGYEWLQREPHHLESYLGLLIPTGTVPNGRNLFEPVVGFGHHVGLMFGGATGILLWNDDSCDRNLRVEVATHSQYLFSKTQRRAIDLKNKPWSRYMEVYADEAQAEEANSLNGINDPYAENLSTPGINVFTLPVKVRPGYMFNMNTALVYSSCNFQAEMGWGLFARAGECVKLACPWQEDAALKFRNGQGFTNPIRTINGYTPSEQFNYGLADYDLSIIKETDLDLASAAQPCVISYTYYGSLGYNWDHSCYPSFATAGASYESAGGSNASIDRWTVWAKAGVSF